MSSTIYLLRHSESEANVDTTLFRRQKNTEIELTPKGIEQADAAGKIIKADLKRTEEKASSLALFTSPYKRTTHTAEIISKHLGTRVRSHLLLSERGFGEQEGCNDIDAYEARPVEGHFYDKLGYVRYTPPRGETMMQVYMRASLFVMERQSFQYTAATVIVSHKGFCAMMHAFFTGEIPDYEREWGNAEVLKYAGDTTGSDFKQVELE